MHILVTNDDGVTAPGLLVLVQAMRQFGDVSVIAPDHDWSGHGHTKHFKRPLRVQEVRLADGTAALATDGEDRITGVAGAIATHLTANQAATIGLDITATLADNDSYAFWQALNASGEPLAGGLVERDPTGTNVNDLLIILRYEN